MRKLLIFIVLLCSLSAFAQNFTAAIPHQTTITTGAPSQSGSRLKFDLTSGRISEWSPTALTWLVVAQGIDEITGCIPPAYSPGYAQSSFAINACDSLYRYRSGAWHHLNAGGSGSDGNGIYDGSGEIPTGTIATAQADAGGWGDVTPKMIFNDVGFYESVWGDGFKCFGFESSSSDSEYAAYFGFKQEDPNAFYVNSRNNIDGASIYLSPSYVSMQNTGSMYLGANDGVTAAGLWTQDADYSSSYQPHSFVDKAWVESQVAASGLWTDGGATTYLSATGDKVAIGATSATARLMTKGTTSTASAYSLAARNAADANILTVRNDGQVGIGSNLNITTDSALSIASIRVGGDLTSSVTYTNNTVTDKYYAVGFLGGEISYAGSKSYLKARGIDFNVFNNNTATNNDISAGFFSARNNSTSSRAAYLTGLDCSAYTDNQNGGTVSDIAGVRIRYMGISAAGPTATAVYGVKIQDLLNSGTITNTYGFYVGALAVGTQTNAPYSFYGSDTGARNYFAGQTGIGVSAPNASAKLEISSTTQGVLFPRMTEAQRDAISSPANGLVIYNTTTDKLQVRAAGAWVDLH